MSNLDLWHSINQFYYREARYLDDLDFSKWVALFADDVKYWMPIIQNRIGKDVGNEMSRIGDLAHFEDDKESLANRVKRLQTGRAWAETPPGRTNHMVSNVEIMDQADGLTQARSKFLIYRSHMETDQEMFSGTRLDKLRKSEDTEWSVVERTIILDHAVLTQKSLGIFF